jgi:ADP-ribose pyrophosphatase YjhB (NUDIX family)
MNFLVTTGLLVRNDSGKILLVKKNEGPYADVFHIPGGVVKNNETVDEAVQKRFFEETGLKTTNIKRVMFDDEIAEDKLHALLLFYTGDHTSGELRREENEEMKWFSPAELMGVTLSEPVQKLLAVIGTYKGKFIFPAGMYI